MDTKTFFYLDDHSEYPPCDCTPEGWAAWLAAGGNETESVAVPADGTVLAASSLTIFGWVRFDRKDGPWQCRHSLPEHDFAATVDGDGAAIWWEEDILGSDYEAELAERFDMDSDPDEVWVALGRNARLSATFHADGPSLTFTQAPDDD